MTDGGGVVDAPSEATPIPPTDGGPAITRTLGTGNAFSCSLRTNGSVWCWGSNWAGAIGVGDSDVTADHAPTAVLGITTATRLAVGMAFACVVKTDHTVWCWGENYYGEMGQPIAMLDMSPTPMQLAGLSDVVDVSAGASYACALESDGSVWCWGSNDYDELGHDNTSDPIATRTPIPYQYAPQRVGGLSGADAIACSDDSACAHVGTHVACWGDNRYGALGHTPGAQGDVNNTNPTPTPANVTGAVAVYGGGGGACVIDGSNTASCWGTDSFGQLGDLGAAAGGFSAAPVAVSLTGVTIVSPGYTSTCAVTNQAIYCWGDNLLGEEGVGTCQSGLVGPENVTGLTANMTTVSAATGGGHACAATSDNHVWCWGNNQDTQCGVSVTGEPLCNKYYAATTPVEVVGLP